MGGEVFGFMAQDLQLDVVNNIILSAGNIGSADEGIREKFVELAHRLQGMVNDYAAMLLVSIFLLHLVSKMNVLE